jgi:glycosyltransferase EpsH
MNPMISVIIAAYNSEKYLEKCLDSIFNQTYKDFEVIIVNDGSADRTQQICEYYAAEHDNLILINQENGGVATARNSALKVCKGEYITFSDSDDYVEQKWIQKFMDTIKEDKECDLVVGGITVNYENSTNCVQIQNGRYINNEIINAFLTLKERHIEGFLFNKLYKKSIIEDHSIRFEYILKEDYLFNLKYLYYVSSIVTVSSSCYHYVQHRGQSLISKRYPADYMKNLITSLRDAALALSDKYKDTNMKRNVLEEYLLSFSVLLYSMYHKGHGINDKRERIKYIKEYQQLRRDYRNIRILMGSKTKQAFATFMLLPPKVTDLILSVILKNDY